MMAAFNKIDGYDFDRILYEKNLLEFSVNKSLGRLFLIKIQHKSIGYIVLTFGFSFEYKGKDAFIDEFYIKDEYRNKGVGKKTMEFIETIARKLDIQAIHLEVEKHNSHANNLYTKQGFMTNSRNLFTKNITNTNQKL